MGCKKYCKRGQIILIMCMTLVIVILSISTMIYFTSTQHLFFNYNPSREIVLGIDSDFDRALTRILASATDFYNRTITQGGTHLFEIGEARALANRLFSHWILSVQTAYTGKGINIEVNWTRKTIQRSKNIDICIYDESGRPEYYSIPYSERILENLFKLFWYKPNSISVIGADISVDSVTGGIVGWRSTHIILLNLTINSIIPRKDRDILDINITILKEGEAPVNDLNAKNFEIYLFDRSAKVYGWRKVAIKEITYNGGGNYILSVNTEGFGKQFWNWGDYRYIIVRVKDNRDIIVEAYSYAGVEYVIQSFVGTHPKKTKEKYVFEIIPNGTIYWYGEKLRSSAPNPPIPFPPVKQFIVEVTVNGPTDTAFEEVPYQIEAWDDRYLWPLGDEFLNYTRRFMNGSKLVFQVYYPPMVDTQKVRITWRDDCDYKPIPYNLEMTIVRTEDGKVGVVKGERYILEVIVERRKGQYVHVDWSLRLWDRDHSWFIDYILPAYDSYFSERENTYYIPIKFPDPHWTVLPKPKEEGDKEISRAPVRLILYNVTDRVITTSPAPYQEITDELRIKQMLYIPYDVWYFQYFVNATWKKPVDIRYSYLVFAGMIGGPPDNQYIPKTVKWYKWGSLLVEKGSTNIIINGTFNNVNQYIPHRGYALGAQVGDSDYSYWAAMYNESIGAALFCSKQMLELLDSYGRYYGDRDQLFVWTRTRGASRFMEYDAIRLESASSPSTRIDPNKTPRIEFKVAGFLLSGGKADEDTKYDNDKDWYDGVRTGMGYAAPFTRVLDPSGTTADIILKKRNAILYEDFSTDPFAEGRLVTNTEAWSWTSGYIHASADGPSTSWGGANVAHCPNNVGGSTLYILSKLRYSSTTGSHVGFIMSETDGRFYTAEFYRDGQNNRRLAIWKYTGTWPSIPNARTNNLSSLSDNTWLIFLGSVSFNDRRVSITAYDNYGNEIRSVSYNDNNLMNTKKLGLQIRDEVSGGGSLSATFDFLVISADADPSSVTIEGLGRNWRVRIEDASGAPLTSWAAADNRGVANINVRLNPIMENVQIRIQDRGRDVITKKFSKIVGGDVYVYSVGGVELNAVEECNMYYKMFTCKNEHIPEIISIEVAYKKT